MEYLQGNIIARFILNNCTPQEKKEVTLWLQESDQNQATFRHLEGMIQQFINTIKN